MANDRRDRNQARRPLLPLPQRRTSPGRRRAPGKSIFSEYADSLTAAAWHPLAEGIGLDAIRQGEGPLVYKSNMEEK